MILYDKQLLVLCEVTLACCHAVSPNIRAVLFCTFYLHEAQLTFNRGVLNGIFVTVAGPVTCQPISALKNGIVI